MKRIACFSIALMLVFAGVVGCTQPIVQPTPSPIATVHPVVTPIITPMPTQAPTPMAPANSPGTANNTGATGNGGTAGTMSSIPNFKSGTEVLVNDLPELKTSLQEKYEGATIGRISHGLYKDQQVYVVEYKDQAGKQKTIYYTAGGQFLT